jgi:hypothetical protein
MGKSHTAAERKTSHSAVQTKSSIDLDEVLAAYEHPSSLREGEFTVAIYGKRRGVSSYEARGTINRALRDGKVERVREIWIDGDKMWAYRLTP